MSRPDILDALARRVLLVDGAMGSHMQAQPLDVERDYWNCENCTDILTLSRPDLVRAVHAEYFAAGADMVETNSFGGSPLTLGEFGIADKRLRAQQAGPANWRARRPRALPIAGATASWSARLGPGTQACRRSVNIAYQPLEDAFAVQCRGPRSPAASIAILIETCQDPLQIKAAVNGAKRARAAMPASRSRSSCR